MNIFGWILLGIVVGVIANALDPNPSRGGVLGAMVLGILGAIVGGFFGSILLGVNVTGFNVGSILISVVGALLVLLVGRQFNKSL